MTGRSQADAEMVTARGMETELSVKRGHSKNLVLRDFQPTGNFLDGIRPQIPVNVLDSLQNRDEISPLALEFPPEIRYQAVRPRLMSFHTDLPLGA